MPARPNDESRTTISCNLAHPKDWSCPICNKSDWTAADIACKIYGDNRWTDFWEWEVEIMNALYGAVPLSVAIKVVNAAHQAYREGASNALCD